MTSVGTQLDKIIIIINELHQKYYQLDKKADNNDKKVNTNDKKVNTNDKKASSHHELEIRINTPMPYEMGHLINIYKKHNYSYSINQFIEIISIMDDKKKIRLRSSQIPSLKIMPNKVIGMFRTKQYETKTILDKFQVDDLILTLSDENSNTIYSGNSNLIKLYFVQQCTLVVKNWIIDFKYKYNLPLDSKYSCENIINNGHKALASSEIEFNKNFSDLVPQDLIEFKSIVIGQLFLTTLSSDNLYLSMAQFSLPLQKIRLSTMHEYHSSLLYREDNLSLGVTPKIDGTNCYYANINSIFYYNTNGRDIVFSQPSSIKKDFYGRGEFIQNTILAFFVYFPELKESTRLQHLTELNNLISNGLTIGSIKLASKPLDANIQSKEERCQSIIKMLEYTQYPIDGVVLIDTSTILNPMGCKIVDYKFKPENTFDVLGVNILDSNTIPISKTNLYVSNGKNTSFLKTIIHKPQLTNHPGLFVYDNFYYFHKMIIECNSDNTFSKIRPDKYHKFLKIGQTGNDLEMINKLKNIDEHSISIDILQLLANNFNPTLITIMEDNNKSLIKRNPNIVSLVNGSDKDYFSNVARSNIGVLSNWVKTAIIYSTCGNYVTNIFGKSSNNVLIIDGGVGGDVRKYHSAYIREFYITDYSYNALLECEKMLKNYETHSKQSQKGNIGRYEIRHSSILDKDYITEAKKFKQYYDIIDWQFAIHFSWHKDMIKQIINTLDKLSTTGTKLLISCANGDELKSTLEDQRSVRYMRAKDSYMKFDYLDELSYTFYMDDAISEPLTEYYVTSTSLVSNLEKVGFELYTVDTFENYKISNRPLFDSGIYKYEEQESTKNFYNNVAETMTDKDMYNNISKYHNLILYYVFIKQ